MSLKRNYVRSNKIRKSAKGQECTLQIPGVCNHNPETTVLAHINSEQKGLGIKSDDICAAYACSDCHAALDGGKLSESDYWFYAFRGVQRTLVLLRDFGIVKVA